MNNTSILSFRAHKNLKSWLSSAGRGFPGGAPELLRLILTRAALEQGHTGFTGFLGCIVPSARREHVGNTAVFAARLPVDIIAMVKNAAAGKHQGVSVWAAGALFQWYISFKEYQGAHENDDGDWLEVYGMQYRKELANWPMFTHQTTFRGLLMGFLAVVFRGVGPFTMFTTLKDKLSPGRKVNVYAQIGNM